MPFFLATASPSFSALTTDRGRATAAGAIMNALLPERSMESSRQRMIFTEAGRGLWQCSGGLRVKFVSATRQSFGL